MGSQSLIAESEVNNVYRVPSVPSLYLSSVINKTIKTSASKQLYSISQISTLAFENSQQVNIKSTDMARQRRGPESEKQYEANISSPDLPPSYEDTIKTGQAGGFVDPNVKTIVRVVQVQMPERDHDEDQQQAQHDGLEPQPGPLLHHALALLLSPLLCGQPTEREAQVSTLQDRPRQIPGYLLKRNLLCRISLLFNLEVSTLHV